MTKNKEHIETEDLSKIREVANYSLKEVLDDQNSIDFEKIIKEIY